MAAPLRIGWRGCSNAASAVSLRLHLLCSSHSQEWQSWRTWPSLTIAMDLGSDGNSAFHALAYKWQANVIQWADGSHGANRDFNLLLNKLHLKNFWVLMCCSWNLPHGRPEHNDDRYWQLRKAMEYHFEAEDPMTSVLFQAFLPSLRQELIRAGVDFPGERDVDVEVLRAIHTLPLSFFLAARQRWRRWRRWRRLRTPPSERPENCVCKSPP